jgi:hypothetical protein
VKSLWDGASAVVGGGGPGASSLVFGVLSRVPLRVLVGQWWSRSGEDHVLLFRRAGTRAVN